MSFLVPLPLRAGRPARRFRDRLQDGLAYTTGLAVGVANAVLNHWTGRAAWTAPAGLYVKLHLGDPGAAGTANPAAETTRKATTFGANAAAGTIANTAAVSWTAYPAAETVTHFSLWDAATAGTFQGSGALAAPKTMAVGETLTEAVGALVLSLTPIAA